MKHPKQNFVEYDENLKINTNQMLKQIQNKNVLVFKKIINFDKQIEDERRQKKLKIYPQAGFPSLKKIYYSTGKNRIVEFKKQPLLRISAPPKKTFKKQKKEEEESEEEEKEEEEKKEKRIKKKKEPNKEKETSEEEELSEEENKKRKKKKEKDSKKNSIK